MGWAAARALATKRVRGHAPQPQAEGVGESLGKREKKADRLVAGVQGFLATPQVAQTTAQVVVRRREVVAIPRIGT